MDARDGFLLKAIAVEKQAVKLDPVNVEMIGLVADSFEKVGMPQDAADWRQRLPGG